MALLTAHTKLPVVHIFRLVTRQAVVANGRRVFPFGRFLPMTIHTGDFAMCTIQRIFGTFVMVKSPQPPRPGVVTAVAALAQFLLMFVFLLVAGVTLQRHIFEFLRLVTALTGSDDMPPGQREFGQTVIKLFHFPGFIGVTGLASLSCLPFVLVVFFVAAETVCRRLAKALQILVAGRTLHNDGGVRIAQFKFGLVMIKAASCRLPVALYVTALALTTQRAIVLIILFVAAVAIFWSLFEHGTFVAVLAFHIHVFP